MTLIKVYGKFTAHTEDIDFDNDQFKLALLTASYTPSINTHESYAALTGQVVGDGYTTGGEDIPNTHTTYAAGVRKFDADSVPFDPVSLTGIRYGAVYDNTPTDPAEKWLVALIDYESARETGEGGNFTNYWNAAGIITLEANPE